MTDNDIEPIEWKLERWKLKDLKGFPNNPRILSKHMYKELRKSLEQDGNHGVLKVNADGTIIGGNQRAKLLKDLGEKEVDVKVCTRQLNDEESRRINLRDNKVQADFDIEMLANYYDPNVLVDAGFTPEEMGGFNPEDVEQIESEEGDDEAPEPPKDPETKRGDIYELGEHRLMCGDSVSITDVEKVLNGEKINLVFTDPPYGYKYESNRQTKHKMIENDDKIIDFMPVAFAVMEEDSAIFVCTSHQVIDKWKPIFQDAFTYKNLIVWKKNNWSMGDLKGSFAGQHEFILFGHKGRVELSGKRETDVWEFDRDPPENHPTQKPVDLIKFAMASVSVNGENVLDLFGGSGSTLIACEQTNRKCFMMELSPNYCDVIVNRWVQFRKKHNKEAVVKRNGKVIEIK